MSLNPTGPITAEEMRRIADLPFGRAEVELRKHDPMWGRTTGAAGPITSWRVRFIETVRMAGYVTVQAASEKDAQAAAEAMQEAGKVTCDDFLSSDDMELDSVEPA